MPLRSRAGLYAGRGRLTHILVNVGVSFAVTIAVTFATAAGLTLGLN